MGCRQEQDTQGLGGRSNCSASLKNVAGLEPTGATLC